MARNITITLVVLALVTITRADTIHVNWDGTGDHLTIQEGIGASTNGDEVLVHPGTYVERINLLGKAITLRSTDGPDVTIIDGNAGGSVITCSTSEGPGTLIEGFTVTNGQATEGGGMYNSGSSPTLANCTFSGNSADYSGGGMYNWNNSSPTLTNCTFSGNWADSGGGMCNYSSSPTVINCAFSENTAPYGGGMWTYGSSPTLTNCTFGGNSGIFEGGGMYNVDSSPTLTNCTFSGNSSDFGGGMYNTYSSPTLANCILWGNSTLIGPQIYNYSGTTTATYSCIQGGWTGAGNIDTDPQFTAPDDVHLMPGSPCIDAANNASTPACVLDPDGRARLWDDPATPDTGAGDPPIVDMGAYEFGSPSATDCNNNCQLDECDVDPDDPDGDGWVSGDCNANGIPDECDIADATSPDMNPMDGIPDECQGVPLVTGACCLGDYCMVGTESACLDAGGEYQGDDTDCDTADCPPTLPGDLDNDCDVDLSDLAQLLAHYGETCE